jgi:hypothetical protein
MLDGVRFRNPWLLALGTETDCGTNRGSVRVLDVRCPATDEHHLLLLCRRLRTLWQGSLPLHMEARTQKGTAENALSRTPFEGVPNLGSDVNFTMTMGHLIHAEMSPKGFRMHIILLASAGAAPTSLGFGNPTLLVCGVRTSPH